MQYIIRPVWPWTEPVTADDDRRSAHAFSVGWDDTVAHLVAEVEHLGGQQLVLQVDVTEAKVRRDGMLRHGADVGQFPGVRVSFDSKHGPLTYATDAYVRRGRGLPSWQANVRAIALALTALRAVDRYGVSGRGEQYRGWQAIAARPAVMTRQQAAEMIAEWSGLTVTGQAIERDATVRQIAYRAAAKRTHPDLTRDPDTFARINVANDLLNATAS